MGNIFSSWMGDDEQAQNSTLTDVIVNNGTSSNLSEVVVNKGFNTSSSSNSNSNTSGSLVGGAAKKTKKTNKKNQKKLGPINRIKKDAELLKKKVKKLKK